MVIGNGDLITFPWDTNFLCARNKIPLLWLIHFFLNPFSLVVRYRSGFGVLHLLLSENSNFVLFRFVLKAFCRFEWRWSKKKKMMVLEL